MGNVLRQVAEWPDRLTYIGTVIQDYNTLTAATFNERYGGDALNRVMELLNEGVAYGEAVYQNLSRQPVGYHRSSPDCFSTLLYFRTGLSFLPPKGAGVIYYQKRTRTRQASL
ncbi:MAG: hypothetical protein U5J63_17240 [Fodinibius sp.]|nr:hypothetical protein [Fodinibius sp.]